MKKSYFNREYSLPCIYRILIFVVIATSFIGKQAKAQSGTAIYDAINVGPINSCAGTSFNSLMNNDASNGFVSTMGQPSPEVWYTFTLTAPTLVGISTCGSNFDTYLHVLDYLQNILVSVDDNGPLCSGTRSSIQQVFQPGTYYIAAEGYSGYTGDISFDFTVASTGGALPAGATMANAISAGTLGAGIYTDSRSNADPCMGNEIGFSSNDIFYSFTLAETSTVKLSHCGSTFDTYMHLLDNTGTLIAGNDDNGPLCAGTASSIKMTLPAGTYYLVSEGYSAYTGTIVTTMSIDLPGALFSTAIDVGTLQSGDSYSNTRNNTAGNGYGNEMGQVSDDIFYKFTLNVLTNTEVNISHCGSTFDTYLHLLDAAGNVITYNDDSGPLCLGTQSSIRISLGSGTYYVVSEGYSSNAGNIITQISVGQGQGWTATDQNYVRERTPLIPVTDYSTLNSISGDKNQVKTSTQYLDGLGRLIQTVQRQGTASGNDLVQPTVYDGQSREIRRYLPYKTNTADGAFKIGNPEVSVKDFYNPAAPGASSIAVTLFPYSVAVIENSAAGRLLEQGAEGDAWQPASALISGSGHTVKRSYGTNSFSEIKLWTINATGASAASTYNGNQLMQTISTDENGNRSITYKDKLGHIILKQAEHATGAYASTYYVYDEMANLRYIIPPAITATAFNETDAIFDQYIYAYHYDDLNRLTEKKIPGKGWEYYVYNKNDKIALSQDAVQRQTGIWRFIKYDGLGNVVITGDYQNAGTRAAVQATFDAFSGANWETYTGSGPSQGYNNASAPTTYNNIQTVNYYGDYNIPGKSSAYNASVSVSASVNGLLTGSKVNILGTADLLLTVNYYDDYKRIKEVISQNHLGGTDRVVNNYNFSAELISSTRTHVTSSASVTIANRLTYDHMGRKTAVYQKINNDPEVKLYGLAYNELGQLINKSLHDDIQSTTYAYHVRGWLTTSTSNQFSYQLKYNDGAVPQFNGNISEQLWGAAGTLDKSYAYTYDKLNRLQSGISNEGYNESITYDLNNNILSLSRAALGTNSYTYAGNRLSNISGFTNGSYSYDLNGNMTGDGPKGISIAYNNQQLPASVTGLQTITYLYDAAQRKLKKQSSTTGTSDYIAGIQYKNGVIEFIQTEVGRAIPNGSQFIYQYSLTDHLSNSRVDFYKNPVTGNPEIIQRDDYYPFGQQISRFAGSFQDFYLYNTKELQSELNQYDHGARFYDPGTGRWNTIDPMNQTVNGYDFCGNNPIMNVDPDGKFFGTILGFLKGVGDAIFSGGLEFWNANKSYVRDAWKKADPTLAGTAGNNGFKIDMGLFKGNFGQVLSRLTWELPQTLLGNAYSHVRNLAGSVDNVDYYKGATLVNKNDNSGTRWGMTLGGYINSLNLEASPLDEMFRHEYGHTIQSRSFGIFYIPVIGVPSLISSAFSSEDAHANRWYEKQASRNGYNYFLKNEPNALILVPWNFIDYPIN